MGLVEAVYSASKASGFVGIDDNGSSNAYHSLINRLLRIVETKNVQTAFGEAILPPSQPQDVAIEGEKPSNPMTMSESGPTLENLQNKLGGALENIRRRLWPSSEAESSSSPIIPYSTGSLVMPMVERPVKAKEHYLGKDGKSSGKWSFEIGINGQNPPSVLGWLVLSEENGEKKYDMVSLNIRGGTFSIDGRTVQYFPPSLKIRGGDVLTSHVDIDNLTFSFTLNGIRLPNLHAYVQDGDCFDRYIEEAPNPGSAFKWPSSRVLINLSIGQNALFYPMVSYSKQSPIHIIPSLSSEFAPIFDLSPMRSHKEQCDLLLELLWEVLPHAKASKEARKSKLKLGALRARAAVSNGSVDAEQVESVLNLLIGSNEVGLKAMFPDETLEQIEEMPQLHHTVYALHHSVIPFLVRLQNLELNGLGERMIDRWVNVLPAENDDWSQNLLTQLLETLLNILLRSADNTMIPLHPEMTIRFEMVAARPLLMSLLIRLLELPRLYYLAASSGLFVKMLPNLFAPSALDHQVRLEPYVAKESWKIFEELGAITELSNVLQSIKFMQDIRQEENAKLIYTLSRHPPIASNAKDPESRKNTNEFIMALRSFIGSNPDILRMKTAATYSRPALNGLLFALLGAMELSKSRLDRIFNNVLHSRILLDPSRSLVDRLGGTYSHVASHYPNAFGEPHATNPEMPEIEFRDSQTSWPFELLDAAVFLYYYAFVPAWTQTQTYSNDIEMATRTVANLNASKLRRGSDRPCADLDLAIQIQNKISRVSTLNCVISTMELFNETKFLLIKKFGDWMSQMLIHTALHPTRNLITYYIPESYVHMLITIESNFRILGSKSAMNSVFSYSYPDDNTSALPPSERESTQPLQNGFGSRTDPPPRSSWQHSLPACALSLLVQKNVILNPNLISVIISYLSRVVGSISLSEPNYVFGPKRFAQFMDVTFTSFTDNKHSHWTTILDGLVPFLADSDHSDTCKLYRTYFTRWISEASHRQKVENFLNGLFNFGSWTENEFDTHIDNYIEKLKNLTLNVEHIVADPKRVSDIERPESRSGRQQAEERGFAKANAKPEWEVNELEGGKVVVVLPEEDVYARLHLLKELVTLQQGLEATVREVPLYLFVLNQLLFTLASIAQLNPLIFDNPLIMTRTCELVGHTLRRTLDQSSSPPFVKFARLVGQSLGEHDTIISQSPQPMPFYDTNAKQLVWACTKLIVSLLRCNATKALCLQSLAGLITNSAVELYLTFEFTNIPEWHETQSILQDLKHVAAREVLLRSGQEECPICYTNPVNTTFEPCGHRSCQSCIDRHLLNNSACFFCKAKIESTRRDGF